MAIIPTSNFGKVVTDPGRVRAIPPGATGIAISEGGVRFGSAGMAIAADMAERRQRAQTEEEQAAARERQQADKAVAMNGAIKAEALLRERRDVLNQDVLEGRVEKGQAVQTWDSESGKLIEEVSSQMPGGWQPDVKNKLLGSSLELRDSVRGTVQRKDREDTRAGLLGSLEGMEREALFDRGHATETARSLIRDLGPAAGFGADDQQRMWQNFREKAAFNVASSLVRGARDDHKDLDEVLARVKSPEFADLSPERLGQLEQQVLGRKQYLMNQEQTRIVRGEAALAKREREGEAALKTAQAFMDGGAVPDAAFTEELAAKVAGTSSAQALTVMLRQAGENAGFALMTPEKQQAELLAMRAQANAQGSNPKLEAMIASRERVAAKSAEQLASEPLLYGMTRRLIGEVVPLDLGNPGELGAALPERVAQAQTVSARVGRPVSPLLASEAKVLATQLKVMPLEVRVEAIRDLAKRLPDPQMIQAVAAQVDPQDRGLALAMFSADKRGPNGESPSALILRGKDAVSAGRIKDTGEDVTQARAEIARKLSEVPWASTRGRDAAIEAASLTWLGLKDERRENVRRAIDIATGGLADWAGSKVPIPYGMTERDFTRSLRGLSGDALSRMASGQPLRIGERSVSPAELAQVLPDTRLIPVGDGIYTLQAGGVMVMAGQGVFRLRMGR